MKESMNSYKVSLAWCFEGQQTEKTFDWTTKDHEDYVSSTGHAEARHLQTAIIFSDRIATEVVEETGCNIRFTMTINDQVAVTFTLLPDDGRNDSVHMLGRTLHQTSVVPTTADTIALRFDIMRALTGDPNYSKPDFLHDLMKKDVA